MNAKTSYRQTEVGEMPKEWLVRSLNEVVIDIKSGASLGPEDFAEDGFPVLHKGDIKPDNVLEVGKTNPFCNVQYAKEHESSIIDGSYLVVILRDLVPTAPAIGLIAQSNGKYLLAQGAYGFRCNKEYLDPSFLVHLSNSNSYRKHVRSISVGSTQVHIRTPEFFRIKIPVPPMNEQQKISSILSSVDYAVQKTREIIAKTQELKKGLMQLLLTKGIGHVKFKRTIIGEIPQEWRLSRLSNVSEIIDCKHRTPKYTEVGYPVVRPSDLKPANLSLEYCLRTSFEEYQDLTNNYEPKRGDIVFSRNASFGVASYVKSDEKFAIGQDVVIVTSDSNSTLFLFYVLNSSIIGKQLERLSTGSTFKRINLEEIRELKVPEAPLIEQQQIASVLSKLDEALEQEHQKRLQLTTLKKGLMQDLLSGKVRVKVN